MLEDNKKIAKRVFDELFSRGDMNIADELFAANYVAHDPSLPKETRGPEQLKQLVRMYRTGFPDLQFTVEEQLAEGDTVVTRFTARGTHRGEFFGLQPTGNRATTTGIVIERLENGRIVESWINYDAFGLMRQLGFGAAQPSAAAREQPEQPRH